MTTEYVAVQGQLTGTAAQFELVANSDRERFRSRKAAIKHGLNYYDHDDFWIATVEGQRLVDVRWMDKEREHDDEEWAAVRSALGLQP